tara:strand:+ start:77 stop:253 length:177 start_codon:yes stop_codon:yes gene_type:complete
MSIMPVLESEVKKKDQTKTEMATEENDSDKIKRQVEMTADTYPISRSARSMMTKVHAW